MAAQLPTTAMSLVSRHVPMLAPHALSISGFLDASPHFSRDAALATGSPLLLQRVLTRELALLERDAALVVHKWVWTTLQHVITQTSKPLPLVQCLVTFIHPTRSHWDVVTWAITARDLALVQWLYALAMERHGAHGNPDAMLREAVLGGDVTIVTWLLDQPSSSSPPLTTTTTKPLDLAVLAKLVTTTTAFTDPTTTQADYWAIVELVLERRGLLAHRSLPLLAAQQGRLDTLHIMKQHGVVLDQAIANAAAAKGHFDIVVFLGLSVTSEAMDDAALDGQLKILETLWTKFQCAMTAIGVLRAADRGHLDVLVFAWTTFPEKPFWTDFASLLVPAFRAAVDAGHLDVVTWLYETHLHAILSSTTNAEPAARQLVHADSAYLAFQHNHLHVIQYLHTHGLLDWTDWEGGNAAYYCDLTALEWLHTHQLMGETPRNELSSAVWAGRLDCIQWILDNRPMEHGTYAVEYALLHNRLDALELLLAKQLSSSFRAIDFAASRGHVDAIRRLIAYRHAMVDPPYEGDEASVAAIHSACLAGHLEVVQYLTEQPVRGGTCTTAAMDAAASKGYLPIVQYLHMNRTEGCTVAAMDAAAVNGDMAMVKFLHEHRSEGCSSAALEGAASKGHFDMVQFVVANYPQTYAPHIAVRARAKGELEIALWLEQRFALPVKKRRESRSLTTESVLPQATPIVG